MKLVCLLAVILTASHGLQASTTARLNINVASAQQLATHMHGVGPKKALAIIVYRKKHGPFKHIDDLLKVKGIGPKTLAKNRDHLSLGE